MLTQCFRIDNGLRRDQQKTFLSVMQDRKQKYEFSRRFKTVYGYPCSNHYKETPNRIHAGLSICNQ